MITIDYDKCCWKDGKCVSSCCDGKCDGCVEACPTDALELVDIEKYEEFTRRKRLETAAGLQENEHLAGKLLLDLVQTR